MGMIASYLRKIARRRPEPPPAVQTAAQPPAPPPALPVVPDGWIPIPARGIHTVAPPRFATHLGAMPYLSATYNHPGMSVLEVGSRVVTGANYRAHFANARYVGFDFYAGPNVDIAGDAHKLSTYFDASERFDLVYSLAVLEHLYAKLPQVRGRVAYWEVSTPLSMQWFCGWQRGELYGLDHDPQRLRQRWLRPRTRVPGLWLTGQDVMSCGVSGAMMGGVAAATAVAGLRRMTPVMKRVFG